MSWLLRWLVLGAVAALLHARPVAQASPQLAQARPGQVTRNTAFFQQAKKDLPEPYYFLYRIVDRLARANQLDTTPWRIVSVPKYDMNAFATEVNLIAVYTGLLDVLAGDADAIACVVGHEMSHHVERHIPLKQADLAKAQQRLDDRKQELIRKEKSRQASAQGWSIFSNILQTATGVSLPINPAGNADPARMEQDLQAASDSEVQNLAIASQQMEFAADRVGYAYVSRAGFDPQGCLRVMDVLGRMPEAEFDGTHPAIPRRAKALRALMVEQPPSSLAAEGRVRLQGSSALTYTISEDRKSLRVNSRYGSAKGGFVMSDL
ncbi:MAG: M48 family metallopeptidase [Cyanobacteriota bacterium]|jgi:predicted Zn-dependent protease